MEWKYTRSPRSRPAWVLFRGRGCQDFRHGVTTRRSDHERSVAHTPVRTGAGPMRQECRPRRRAGRGMLAATSSNPGNYSLVSTWTSIAVRGAATGSGPHRHQMVRPFLCATGSRRRARHHPGRCPHTPVCTGAALDRTFTRTRSRWRWRLWGEIGNRRKSLPRPIRALSPNGEMEEADGGQGIRGSVRRRDPGAGCAARLPTARRIQ